MASSAGSSEGSSAGRVAGGTGTECATWSIGRSAAMVAAKAATHRGVAVTRHRTIAVVH